MININPKHMNTRRRGSSILIIIPCLEERIRRTEVSRHDPSRASIQRKAQLTSLKRQPVRELRPKRSESHIEQLLVSSDGRLRDAQKETTVAVVVQLAERPVRVRRGLEDLSDAGIPARDGQERHGEPVDGRGRFPVRDLGEFGAAVRGLGELGAVRQLRIAGGFHDHGAVAGFGEEVGPGRVLVAGCAGFGFGTGGELVGRDL